MIEPHKAFVDKEVFDVNKNQLRGYLCRYFAIWSSDVKPGLYKHEGLNVYHLRALIWRLKKLIDCGILVAMEIEVPVLANGKNRGF